MRATGDHYLDAKTIRELSQRVAELEDHVECVWCGFVWRRPDAPDHHECSKNPLVVARDTLMCEVVMLRQRVAELEAKLQEWSDWEAMLNAEMVKVVGGKGSCDSLVETLRLRAEAAAAEVKRLEGLISDWMIGKAGSCVALVEHCIGRIREREGKE